jgi:hypothetical protein
MPERSHLGMVRPKCSTRARGANGMVISESLWLSWSRLLETSCSVHQPHDVALHTFAIAATNEAVYRDP